MLHAVAQGQTQSRTADRFAHLDICSWQYPVECCAGVDSPSDGFHEVSHRLGHSMAIQPCTQRGAAVDMAGSSEPSTSPELFWAALLTA